MSPTDPERSSDRPGARARLRGCVGSVLSGGLGCLSFVVGATLAIVLFAPQLLSTYGARVLAQAIDGRIDGRAEVHDVRLSWNKPQRAESVTIFTAEGERLMDGSVEFPSILELLADEGRRGRIQVRVRDLRSSVDDEGRGELARTLRLAPGSPGRSATVDRLQGFADWLKESPGLGERKRVIDFAFSVDRAIFEGNTGRGDAAEVSVTDLDIVGRVDGDRLALDLGSCAIRAQEIPGSEGSVQVRGRVDVVAGTLPTRLELEAGPLPVAVLRTLGLVSSPDAAGPARPPEPARGDLFDAIARGLLALGDGMARGGIEVERLLMEEGPPGSEARRRLDLAASGAFGSIELRADLEEAGEALVLTSARPGENGAPFKFQWTTSDPAAPARWIGPILPQGLRLDSGDRVATVRAFAPSFRLFWPKGDGGPGIAGALADSLRRGDLELNLAEGGAGETVSIVASPGEGTAEAWHLEHRATHVRLIGEMGGTVESLWRGADGELSVAHIHIPGVALPVDTLRLDTTVDLRLYGIPTPLLGAWAAWPVSVGALLPPRVRRLEIAGIPAEHWLDPEPMRRYELALELELEPGRSFAATLSEEQFETEGGVLSLPASDEVVRHLLRAPMPWIEDCRLSRRDADQGQGPERIMVAIENLHFDALEGTELVAGRIAITLPPLEVRLCPALEDVLRGGEGGWLAWSPGRVEYSLDRGRARFRSVELPLGPEESALMSGSSEDGEFDLTGPVELRFLSMSVDPTGGASDSIRVSFRGDAEEVRLGIELPSLRDLDLRALGIGR